MYRDALAEQGLYAVGRGSEAAWAVGEKGLHRFSTNGGESWERLAREDTFQEQFTFFGFMRDLDFPTEKRGWIVGQAGFVLRTSDGGKTWHQIDLLEAETAAGTASGE